MATPANASSSPSFSAEAHLVNARAFGSALAIVDGEVLVGETNTEYRPGTVYVYGKNGGSWGEVATVTAANAEFGDGFGRSFAYDGETLFVGAGSTTGSVHLLRRERGSWTDRRRF